MDKETLSNYGWIVICVSCKALNMFTNKVGKHELNANIGGAIYNG